MLLAVLTDRWREITGANADRAFDELVTAYSGKGRHYHNLDHIEALLALSGEHAARLTDRDTVDLAIFYHDAVYEPTRSDNDAKSAALAQQRLAELEAPADRIAKVARYIEATKHAGAAPTGDGDLDHLLDFDLSILAAEPAAYEAYARAIGKEYAIYPDLLYRPGRAKVLRAFLAMPRIYRAPELAATWEAAARANLAAELGRLI